VSVYLFDPDRNGVELYYDRPRSHWTDDRGEPIVKRESFDYRDLLDETAVGR
jgi:catechol 2,3-dioxygenase